MKKPHILLVEDEKHIAQGIIFNLELEGFLITHAETGVAAMDAFGRHEERLRDLSITPGEYVQRQVRVTPYPTEDIGWVTDQVGPDILLFNTDYPHVEGGRRPFERFERSLGDRAEDIRDRFYADNFIDLMGSAVGALV